MKLNREKSMDECVECLRYSIHQLRNTIALVEHKGREGHVKRHLATEDRARKEGHAFISEYIHSSRCKICCTSLNTKFMEEKRFRDLQKHFFAHEKAEEYMFLKDELALSEQNLAQAIIKAKIEGMMKQWTKTLSLMGNEPKKISTKLFFDGADITGFMDNKHLNLKGEVRKE